MVTGKTSEFLKETIPVELTTDLRQVLVDARKEEEQKSGFWNWIKRTVKKVPIQFIKVMFKVLKAFFKNEVRTLALELFKRATILQAEINAGNMTADEAAQKLRNDAKEIAPYPLKDATFIINFLIELAVFAVKLITH